MKEKTAVGVAEFFKLTAAILFMDTAVKSADIHMIGYELTGSGLVTIKLQGDVSAVQAAMDAGIAAAAAFGGVFGHTILARPHEETERILFHELNWNAEELETGAIERKADAGPSECFPPDAAAPGPRMAETENPEERLPVPDTMPETGEQAAAEAEAVPQEDTVPDGAKLEAEAGLETAIPKASAEDPVEIVAEDGEEATAEHEAADPKEQLTCNLCGDINCPRTKYQPHKDCIHYKNRGGFDT